MEWQPTVQYRQAGVLTDRATLRLHLGIGNGWCLLLLRSPQSSEILWAKLWEKSDRSPSVWPAISDLEKWTREVTFSQLRVIIYSEDATLLPADPHSHRIASAWQEKLLPHSQAALVIDAWPDFPYHIAYATSESLQNWLEQSGYDFRMHHALTVLAACPSAADVVHVEVRAHTMFVKACHQGQLRLANAFAFQSPADFAYFVLAVYHVEQLSTESVPLLLSGAITEDASIVNLCRRYVKQVEFVATDPIDANRDLPLPLHYFYLPLVC